MISHTVVSRTTTSLGDHPVDVLRGTLDVARLAVHAVLSVDLESHPVPLLFRHILVYTSRAESEHKEIFYSG